MKEKYSLTIFLIIIQIASAFIINNKIVRFTNGIRNALGQEGDDNDASSVLFKVLYKRLKEGKGSLTDAETNAVLRASDLLLEHLENESSKKYS